MARAVQLAVLRTRAYQRGDFESSSSRFPASEVNQYINDSITDLYDKLVRARGTDYYETTQQYTTQLQVSSYALPATFYQLLAIEYFDLFNRYELLPYHKIEHPYLSDTNVGWTGYPYYYRLTGANIDILPAPSAANHTFTIRFIPAWGLLVNDSDTVDGVDGWEEWVIIDAARKMATKERDFQLVAILERDRERITERIKALAGARDRHMPRRVVDVRYGRVETIGRKRIPR